MKTKMSVTRSVTFDAAHKLPNYDGLCSKLHGHRWTLEVTISGEVNKQTGMIVDFKELNEYLKERVVRLFDHSYINDLIPMPTAEMMVIYIVKELRIKYGPGLSRVRLYETPNSYCEWLGGCEC